MQQSESQDGHWSCVTKIRITESPNLMWSNLGVCGSQLARVDLAREPGLQI